VKHCIYRMAHGVLPTNFHLFNFGINDNSDCTFCGRTYVETPQHLFIECRQGAPLWFFVKSIFWRLCNHRLKITEALVIYSILPDDLRADRSQKDLCLYLVCLAKYCIWLFRCLVKFQFKPIRGDSTLLMFKSKLRFRIRTDFVRHSSDMTPFTSTWSFNDVLAKLATDGHLIINF
jgi:hypothetical protein